MYSRATVAIEGLGPRIRVKGLLAWKLVMTFFFLSVSFRGWLSNVRICAVVAGNCGYVGLDKCSRDLFECGSKPIQPCKRMVSINVRTVSSREKTFGKHTERILDPCIAFSDVPLDLVIFGVPIQERWLYLFLQEDTHFLKCSMQRGKGRSMG